MMIFSFENNLIIKLKKIIDDTSILKFIISWKFLKIKVPKNIEGTHK